MTGPFVNELRATDSVIRLGSGDDALLHIRVQMAELWDAIRIDVPSTESVAIVKAAAVAAFFEGDAAVDEFVVKLHGFEILHEGETLASVGVRDGSTLLVSRRRRRPVR